MAVASSERHDTDEVVFLLSGSFTMFLSQALIMNIL